MSQVLFSRSLTAAKVVLSAFLFSTGAPAYAQDPIELPDLPAITQTSQVNKTISSMVEIALQAKQSVQLTQIKIDSSNISFNLGFNGNYSKPSVKVLKTVHLPLFGNQTTSVSVPAPAFDLSSSIHIEISWLKLFKSFSELVTGLNNAESGMKSMIKTIVLESLKNEPKNSAILDHLPKQVKDSLISAAFNREWIAENTANTIINTLLDKSGEIEKLVATTFISGLESTISSVLGF